MFVLWSFLVSWYFRRSLVCVYSNKSDHLSKVEFCSSGQIKVILITEVHHILYMFESYQGVVTELICVAD